ncbi:Heat shock protein Hsp90 [Coriobacterium glomerans PW2]|uniref:Chaperone protein HtpG n=1 Tax=Coriobacterium glomerans (strain ATCC 49209 / DSM 20642 / JCM 10262 / PW2) TaxID=700015 RepID=F2NB10_CORGP|nr:molecular chaperone HtpG [Coriobacterium glomerans]AEB07688.1 Heat shock protein Hsp90 [Coriobacterium glomerans PW2]
MRKFKTESKKLLDLMINSIYTNREIFLRELISNASDAVDKLYFKSLTDHDLKLEDEDLSIRVSYDKDARTITVSDNGIGMTAAELEKNLGTIAHSGSQEFKDETEKDATDAIDIIGQFGVGFYSAFMVAHSVRVISRAFGEDDAHVWESDGLEGYTIGDAERERHGTDIVLTLRENEEAVDGEPGEDYDRYLSEWALKDLVTRYSNYVHHPIQMMVTKSREKPKPDDAGDDYKPEYESYTELETVNSMTPIWKKRSSDVKPEDYNEFYKSTFHDFEDPARTISFHAEGTLEYDALLFIPGRAPFDLYSKDYEKGLALYSSNVMIMEKCADLVPDYFSFVRGVIDSADVSLNISRETLQHDRQLHAIANRVEKKITAELEDMRDNDRESFEAFFENFGRGLKYGIYSSYGMKAAGLADLLLFWSARDQKMVTLAEYAHAMPSEQKAIYYAAGDSRERLSKMPIVCGVLSRGFDVLLLTQDVDEFTFQAMRTYEAKDMLKVFEDDAAREAAQAAAADGAEPARENRNLELKNVASDDVDLETEEEKKDAAKATEGHKDLFETMKKALEGKVERVAASARATDAPAFITTEGPMSLEMEKVLSKGPEATQENMPKSQRVLEVNPKHPVFEKLVSAQQSGDTEKVSRYAGLLYDQALLVEGMLPEDPVAFAQAVCELM